MCNSACPLFEHRNLFVCLWSGHYHLCNAMACDRTTDMDDSRVCEVTCLAYELDYLATYDQGVRSSQYKRDTQVSAPKPKKTAKQQSDGLSTGFVQRPQSGGAHHMVQKQLRMPAEEELRTTRKLVATLLPALTEARRAELAAELLESYQRVKTCESFLKNSNGHFPLSTHVPIALYAMAQAGHTHNGFVFLRTHADVREHMPRVNEVAGVLGKKFRDSYKAKTKELYSYAYNWCHTIALR